MRFEVEQLSYPLVYPEPAAFKDTYGGPEGIVVCESYLVRPKDVPSDTVLVFMHPVGGGVYLPMVQHLARAGHHVIYCNSRYRSDAALIMEKVVLDLGAAVRDAKTAPRLREGRPRRMERRRLAVALLPGAGRVAVRDRDTRRGPSRPHGRRADPGRRRDPRGGTPGRHGVLTESLDPAIRDESNPDDRDPELDLYGSGAPVPPYEREWLARYRAAQVDRNRRISSWVRAELARLRDAGRPADERGFVVHGTMADPATLDATIDPNEREAGISYLGDPRVVNNGPVGLARFCSLRSWLSQRSHDDALADGLRAAAAISVPALVVYNGADNVCLPSLAISMYDAIGHTDKQLHRVDGANHYYIGPDQSPKLAEAVDVCTGWLEAHGLGPPS